MKNLKYLWLLAVFCVVGCSSNIGSLKYTKFELVPGQQNISSVTFEGDSYFTRESNDYRVTVSLMEYQSAFVLPLSILNKTGDVVDPKDYSLSVSDGRDSKPLKLFDRKDILGINAKTGSGGNIETQVMNSIMSTINTPFDEKSRMIAYIAQNYFQFRPLYAREKREGILLYLMYFREEDPITVSVKIKGQEFDFRFLPAKK
ncbi:MAG: hypothetical protein WC527_01005 [Candidatus Margulisiibacteriota bacterium]